MESIALEELAIAHLINAEAEKTQAAACHPAGPFTADELIELDRSVAKVLETLVAKEQVLLKKLRLLLHQGNLPDKCDHERDRRCRHRHFTCDSGSGSESESESEFESELETDFESESDCSCECEYDSDSTGK